MAAWAVLVKATFRLYKAAVLGCFHNIKNFHSVVSTDCYTLPLVQLYVLAVTHTRAVRVVLTPLIYIYLLQPQIVVVVVFGLL